MTVQGKGKSKQLEVWLLWDVGWLLHICLMMLHLCPHHHWCPVDPVLLSQAGRTVTALFMLKVHQHGNREDLLPVGTLVTLLSLPYWFPSSPMLWVPALP